MLLYLLLLLKLIKILLLITVGEGFHFYFNCELNFCPVYIMFGFKMFDRSSLILYILQIQG